MPSHPINTRWFNALLRDRGVSQRELCRRLGLDESAMSLTFRGKREMKMTEAVDISRLLGAALSDVLLNAGISLDSTGMRMTTVVGHIDGNGNADVNFKSKGEKISVPNDMPEDAMALIAKAADGPYAMMDGWTYFISAPVQPGPEFLGRYCLVGLQGGETQMRFVRRGYKPGTFNLSSQLVAGVENATLEWLAPVLLIRPS